MIEETREQLRELIGHTLASEFYFSNYDNHPFLEMVEFDMLPMLGQLELQLYDDVWIKSKEE